MISFLPSDLDRIALAVQEAERGTCGEIVPYIVPESDDYAEAIWRAAALGASTMLVAMSIAQVAFDFRMRLGIIGVALATILFALLCATLVAFVPSLKRLAAGRDLLARRTLQRAEEAFIAEEVFATRERVGILLFISLLEHRVIVLGDTGINQRVASEEWSSVVATMVDAIRRRRTAEGITAAVHQCSEILVAHGFGAAPDDVDELRNELRKG
jgi:putative membrane protein